MVSKTGLTLAVLLTAATVASHYIKPQVGRSGGYYGKGYGVAGGGGCHGNCPPPAPHPPLPHQPHQPGAGIVGGAVGVVEPVAVEYVDYAIVEPLVPVQPALLIDEPYYDDYC